MQLLRMFRLKLGNIDHGGIPDRLLLQYGDSVRGFHVSNEPFSTAAHVSAAASGCSFRAHPQSHRARQALERAVARRRSIVCEGS